ncbi:MAG: universal stress protein [Oscillatoriales cyanobacterium]|uniref:Universal stress protein n=1 Tax=Microcoleus anatoxicus PTRS2 TaxID=2705321 RepID=A0ABU8YHZ8_9CYAN|nr:MAG: universal stress protein [Oscillatoriales cyanobacterium]TAE99999.1 MAG: universal stress protein [Oscillatoriales cyanobacterium]TAF44906.1 MAG: universal stress protein [Oscillatoriales cyanobacterium]TAF69169.1 MAG: universal stress protein [Oscillatoriales cyanobacterium]
MKRILVCTDGSIFSQSSYHYAAWLAPQLDASIDVLYVTDVRSQKVASTGNLSGSIGIDADRELLKKLVDLEHEKVKLNHQRAKLLIEEAKQFFIAKGIQNVNFIHETGFLVDIFHEFEATVDIIVLGKRGEAAEFASGHLGANLERIVRASHKPCLVTSRHFKPIERLLLAYDGSPSGEKMLRFLTESPVFKGLELYIVTVTKNVEDQTAIARIEDARHQAQTAGFEPVCCLIEGNPETAIAEYAEENNISLLLMGAYGHSRIRHLVIGSTTAQLLRSSPVPVLLFR